MSLVPSDREDEVLELLRARHRVAAPPVVRPPPPVPLRERTANVKLHPLCDAGALPMLGAFLPPPHARQLATR